MSTNDPELEVIRRSIQDNTNHTVKQTLLTCLLIITVRRQPRSAMAWSAAIGAAIAHYWNDLASLLAHLATALPR